MKKELKQKLYRELLENEPGSEEYSRIVDDLKIVMEYYEINPKLIIESLVYIGGILLVLYFEKTDIVLSKTFSRLRR